MPPPVLVSAGHHPRRAGGPGPGLGPGAGRGVLARPADPGLPAQQPRCSGTSATPAARSRCGCPTTDGRPGDPRAHRPARGQLGQPHRPPGRRPTPTRPRRCSARLVEVVVDAGESPGGAGLHDRRRHRPPGPGAAAGAVPRAAQRGARPLGHAIPDPSARGAPRDARHRGPRCRQDSSPRRRGPERRARVPPGLPGRRGRHLPAHRRRPGDRDPHRRGGAGARPRRARRADPLPRRARHAGRARGGVLRGPRAAVPLGQRAVRVPTTPASC